MTALEQAASSILYAAAQANIGLRVREPNGNARHAREVLYRFRREIGDATLESLQIRFSPDDPDHELWIINRRDSNPLEPI